MEKKKLKITKIIFDYTVVVVNDTAESDSAVSCEYFFEIETRFENSLNGWRLEYEKQG